MNKIHSIVWNAAAGRWVVASEFATRRGRAHAGSRTVLRPLQLAVAVALAWGGAAGAETLQFPGAPVDVADGTRVVEDIIVANGATGVVVGNGGTLVQQGNAFYIGGTANRAAQNLDLSGLSHYVFDNASLDFNVGGRVMGGSRDQTGATTGTVVLASDTNLIRASHLGIGDVGRNISAAATNQGTVRLGQNNTINADSITLGGNQSGGTLVFQDSVTDGTLTLRGSDGESAVGTWNIGTGNSSNYTGATGTVDLRRGVLDAKVDALNIAGAPYGDATATGTLSLGRGVLEANTIMIGERSSTAGNGGSNGRLSIGEGGTVLANAITLGNRTGTRGTVSSNISLDGGALHAGSILAGAGAGTRVITFNDGVLGNRAAGQDMQVDVPVVLAASGEHAFRVDGNDAVMTVSGQVSGNAGTLTKTGEGVLALTGANTYSGSTRVDQGLIRFQSGSNLGTGRIVLDGGGLQWAAGSDEDISARLEALGAEGAVLDTNGNAVTLATALHGEGGQLIKRGDGALTLTADNTHTGMTRIEQGELVLGDGGAAGNVAGDIVNNARLTLNRGDRMSLSANIAGSGELLQAGGGTVVLSGHVAHSGGTRVAAGTLQIGDGGSRGTLGGDVSLAGGTYLDVDRNDTFLLSARVAGDGALRQIGSGTTVLDADHRYAGGTFIAAGALRLGNGGTSGSVTGAIDNQGWLEFNRSDDVLLDNAVSGTGGLVQMGTGTLRIADDQAYTGATRVLAGALQVDGSIRSATEVASNAMLSGNGTIHGDVVNAGVIRPGSGNDYGRLTIQGNYVGQQGQLELNTWLGDDASPSSQLVIDGGSASGSTTVRVHNTSGTEGHTVGDGILVVAAINGATTAADAFKLGNYARNGAFGYGLFRGDLEGKSAENWYLRNAFVVQPPVDPTDPVNPTDPIKPIDPTDPVNPTDPVKPVDPINPVNPTNPVPPVALPIFGRELATYGTVQPLARELGALAMGNRRDRAQAAAAGDRPHAAWVRVATRDLHNRYESMVAPEAKGRLNALQVGSDFWQTAPSADARWQAGGYLSHASSNVQVDGIYTNDERTRYVRGATGNVELQATSAGLTLTGVGSRGGYLDAVVQLTRYGGSANAGPVRLNTRGDGYLASLEAGYPFVMQASTGQFTLQPEVQLVWQKVRFDAGQDAAGQVSLGSTQGLSGRLGINGSWQFQSAGGVQWAPYLAADVWHESDARSAVTYAGKDQIPLEAGGNRASLSAGVNVRLNERFNLQISGGRERSMGNGSGASREGAFGNLGLQVRW
ncbi:MULTISPECIES: autotransporter outer membrane beta-barrel domain-containing protein [Stenotrophomonas]|uniref:autotransporter outer membrane beta-barrel domain-containing protein n=1 Tax=Stenotrophomonas TaxID=40323 RepID=UPI0022EA1FEE|nr:MULTISPECIES: autotransporter outer membrane beta-barrel domain-containing protein [Stenotrophomonas]MDA3304758.1 autotransporter outer membrane beta-barrel domain-containing protein [Stenotrophomonas sp. PI_27]WGS59012.1 autotransporter outer membrane beta-barrel domain-containing protein [Stenotrophomonas pavanii]